MYFKNPIFEWGAIDDAVTFSIKAYNENIMCKKIVEYYPTPISLETALLNSKNPKAIKLANKIDENWDMIEYQKFIKKYLCGRSVIRYFANYLGGPFALIYQIMKLLSNHSKNGEDIVASRI